jgi:hypothetical protein
LGLVETDCPAPIVHLRPANLAVRFTF